MSYNIIRGSDGPTSIFLAGKLGAGWINIIGLIIMALILLPNIIYAVKFKNVENKCKNKAGFPETNAVSDSSCLHLTTFRNNIRAYFAHSKWHNLWYRTYLCNISKYKISQNIQKILIYEEERYGSRRRRYSRN